MRAGADGLLTAAGHRLECAWAGPSPDAEPTVVFLHEGLGSVGLWRDIPQAVAEATGAGAFAYSRIGYGRSDPCPLPRPLDYMHDEALRVLPAVLRAAGIREHVLFGHSDGASIALIHAGGTPQPGLKGLVLEAPHVFAEAVGIAAIGRARDAYRRGDLRDRLARHHGANVDCAFRGWADAWSDPAFRSWNIEGFLAAVRVPILLIQGEDDEYGSAAQLHAIERQAGGPVETLLLPACGHAPHRDRRAEVLAAAARFIRRVAAP